MSTQAADKRRHEYVAEIIHLRAGGVTPNRILEQLHLSPSNAERALQREGRHDLARLFTPLVTLARRHPCPDCHRPCDRKATKCWECRWTPKAEP